MAATSTNPAAKADQLRARRTQAMLEGPIGPTLAQLAAPNVLAMVVQAVVSIAEGVFASWLGLEALAGLALVFPLVMLTQMLSAGAMGGAISGAVARALGAGAPQRASGTAMTAWVIAAICALAFMGVMAVFGRPLFRVLDNSGTSVAAAMHYANVFFPGCIAIWLCHATLSVIRGTGGMGYASLALLAVSLLSIPLSGVLALGWGGAPALGMAGLAWGTVLAHAVVAMVAIAHVLGGRAGLSLRGARVRVAMFVDILRVGFIASLNAILTVLTIVLMVGAVGRHGADALAGYGLGARLEFLMIPVVFGIGAAMTAMVGANIGAGQPRRAKAIAWTGSLAAAAIVGTIGMIVTLWPGLWLGIFLGPEETGAWAAGQGYFHTVAPFYAFFAIGLAMYFASQGAGRMMVPFIGSVLRICVAFGGVLLLAQVTDWGVNGVFRSIAAGMLVYGGFITVALWRVRWG